MVTVLYGKMGTGKSTAIYEMLGSDASLKKYSYLIVPEQKSVIAEREIATQLPPSAQLYIDATNFTRLANKVFRMHGGLKYNYITRSGKSLIMYRAICEVRASLKEYKIAPGKEKSAVSMFLDAVGELKAYGVTNEALKDACQDMENPKLKGRILDLILINSVYERILYERYSDPYDDMLMLERKLRENSVFAGTRVYIDSFYGFTGAQWSVIREISKQAEELIIALDMPMDGSEADYAKIADTSEKIEKMCRKEGVSLRKVSFDEDKLHKNEAIAYLSDNLWSFGAEPLKNHGGVSLISPEDEFDECEYVASRIKKLIMDGAKYSDIAVIVGSLADYDGIIDLILDKHGIPNFFSKQTDIGASPLIKTVFSALRAVDSYKAQDICAYAKCGYTELSAEDCGMLEDYMYRWGINGRRKFESDEYWGANPDGYVLEATEGQLCDLERINKARMTVMDKLSYLRDGFDKKENCKEMLIRLYTFLEDHKIREKLDNEIRSLEKDEAIRTAQIYRGFISALDTVCDIMGDTVLTPESAINVLSYALSGVSVGSIPTGEDKVTVGEAAEIRVKSADHVFILGACAGKFPANVRDEGFFCDSDKIELETYGVNLSSLSEVRSADQLLNFKNAVSLASSTLCVSSPKNDIRGGKNEPSMAYLRIKELLYGITPVNTADIPLIDRIYTKSAARELNIWGGDPLSTAIRELIPDAEKKTFTNCDASLSEESAREIFTSSVNMTQSRIETFVLCHFKYYCDYLLRLRDGKRISFASREIGNLSHAVFERFLKKARDEKTDLSAITDSEIETEVRKIAEDYIRALCGGNSSKRLAHLFERLERSILIFVKSIVKELGSSEFKAEYFELPIGRGDTDVPPLRFKVGSDATLSLYGICDRVDVLRRDDDTYIRVVDYKSGSKTFSLSEVSYGMGLQLLIYLFSLCKMEDCRFKEALTGGKGEIKPAGILYFPLNIGKAGMGADKDFSSAEASELEESAIASGIKRSGVFVDDMELLLAQDKELKGEFIPEYTKNKKSFLSYEEFEELFSEMERVLDKIGGELLCGDARAIPLERRSATSPCEYCANRAVCRRRE